ncbi:hypothetical protein [Vulcanococcus limneticus]|uniref:hypothetical protein n=1 Tax=Vulcanococcus limneticus TaxID=2170428 RepID=UPI00398BF378
MLSPEDLLELEASLLPALERHHLRLLAHSLRSLQQAADHSDGGATSPDAADGLPDAAALARWASGQPGLQADPGFIPVLLEQLDKAAVQLKAIAREQQRRPLQLSIADLVTWGRRQADARLAAGPGVNPSPAPPHS